MSVGYVAVRNKGQGSHLTKQRNDDLNEVLKKKVFFSKLFSGVI